jgi:ketosteroid isomerase-like protein
VVTETGLERTIAALADRVGRLEDVEAIIKLHHTFTRAVADRQFTTLADYFCEDAVIDMRRHGPMAGRSAIAEHFAGMAAVPLNGAGYALSSPVVDVEGDTATGTWTWHRFNADALVGTEHARRWGAWEEGRYRCHYRRVDGVWRFARMHFRVVLPDADDERDGPEAPGAHSESEEIR